MAKKKVNLSVDPNLLEAARSRGIVLSVLLDDALRGALGDNAPPKAVEYRTPSLRTYAPTGAHPPADFDADKFIEAIVQKVIEKLPAALPAPKKRRWFWRKQG